MYFFKPQQPILQKKKLSLESESLALMNCLTVKYLENFNLCGVYTCVDQAMIIWGLISGLIFFGAQFLPISWIDQAVFWSIMTVLGVITMSLLTYSWSVSEKIAQLVYIWGFLMIGGVMLTDYALISSWAFMLVHLAELWLLLSATGYVITGWVLRSRAFLLGAIIHTIVIFVLPYCGRWQFLVTGLVMMSNLLIFSEGQWDMLLPRELKNYPVPKKKRVSLTSYFYRTNQTFS
jgi:hypothetical protein